MPRILVCRTDRLGDCVVTLPLCALLRERLGAEVVFLGRRYTVPAVARSPHVAAALAWDAPPDRAGRVAALRAVRADVALFVFPDRAVAADVAAAGVPRRIGTSRRWWHWLLATERVPLRRGGSPLHEAQLNVALAASLLGLEALPSRDALAPGAALTAPTPTDRVRAWLDDPRFTVVVHPLSGGSAPRWPIAHVAALADRLDPARFRLLLSGGEEERRRLAAAWPTRPPHVAEAMGGTMDELFALLAGVDGVLAPATGPVHVAAALGTRTAGLYPHPATSWDVRRWHPLGPRAEVLTPPTPCARHARLGAACPCLADLAPETVAARLEEWRAATASEPGGRPRQDSNL